MPNWSYYVIGATLAAMVAWWWICRPKKKVDPMAKGVCRHIGKTTENKGSWS